jgi:hypothetical protein
VDVKEWPAGDQGWVTRYRLAMKGKHVPAFSLLEREQELLAAIREAEAPAVQLFGDAKTLATEDAAELATADEAVRTSLGGGLRPALREVAGTWVGIGAVAVLLMVMRHGWSVDLDTSHVLVAASVAIAFLGWKVGHALFAAGRSGSAVGALIAVGTVIVAGIASAAHLGPGHIAASDVPVFLLAPVMLGPGIVVLIVLTQLPQQALRETWDDGQWLRSFRGGLRSRLMPSATARGHVAEIEQALKWAGTTAYTEFGHPLSFARELAAADRVTRARQWWAVTTATTGGPLLMAVLILTNQSWGILTVPIAVAFVLTAAVALSVGWGDRPRMMKR